MGCVTLDHPTKSWVGFPPESQTHKKIDYPYVESLTFPDHPPTEFFKGRERPPLTFQIEQPSGLIYVGGSTRRHFSRLVQFYHICCENTTCRSPTIYVWCRLSNILLFLTKPKGKNNCSRQGSLLQKGKFHLYQSLPDFCSTMMKSHRKTFFNLVTLTFTFKLGLDILPVDLHAKIQGRTFVRSALRVRQTHRHTHSQTMPELIWPVCITRHDTVKSYATDTCVLLDNASQAQ